MFRSSEGMGTVKKIISSPFNYTEQNGCHKNLIRCVLGIDVCVGGGGLVAHQSLLTNKKGTSPFNF